MATVDTLRNDLIDKLLTISNKDYLQALNKLVGSTLTEYERVPLTEEQILMLQLSDEDINAGRLTPQHQADKEDLEWLKSL